MKNNRLRGQRIMNGMRQQDMAESLGISVDAYRRKENGLNYFTEKEIKEIAEMLDVEIMDIFFHN